MNFEEKLEERTAIDGGMAESWKKWGTKKRKEKFAELKKQIVFEYPKTRA
jgi:hypothetical protein